MIKSKDKKKEKPGTIVPKQLKVKLKGLTKSSGGPYETLESLYDVIYTDFLNSEPWKDKAFHWLEPSIEKIDNPQEEWIYLNVTLDTSVIAAIRLKSVSVGKELQTFLYSALDWWYYKETGEEREPVEKILPSNSISTKDEKEVQFFSDAETTQEGSFDFKPGHSARSQVPGKRSGSQTEIVFDQVHNKIQNALYKVLVKEHGEARVGTEIGTGLGTYVDLVVKENSGYIFYEVKTDLTVKMCVRKALSQLMEYAYWDEKDFKVNKLVIVSTNDKCAETEAYLKKLRERFGLPIHYQQFRF